MRKELIIGQCLSLAGMMLLLAFVPFMPQVIGLPRHRVGEMCVFWAAQWMMVLGLRSSLRARSTAVVSSGRQRYDSTLAAGGVLLAIVVCTLALGNLTFSSFQGAGFRPLGVHSGRAFPREVSYALALPLIVAMAMQIPLFGSLNECGATAPNNDRRIFRKVLLIGLFIVMTGFAFTCLTAALDRWFVLATVAATMLSSFLFVPVGFEQLVWSRTLDVEGDFVWAEVKEPLMNANRR